MAGESGASLKASARRVEAYRLEEVLGKGTTGVVHRAVDETGCGVALKIIRPELAGDEVYRRRLAQEVIAAREIRHQHSVPPLDAGDADGVTYIAFAFYFGVLQALAKDPAAPPSTATAYALMLQVGLGGSR
jgi:serine/threonine-protein kinase